MTRLVMERYVTVMYAAGFSRHLASGHLKPLCGHTFVVKLTATLILQ